MHQTVFEYIEVDYNRTRMHSALGDLNPVNFEHQNVGLNEVSSVVDADH
ncbi:IS3 family transposase (plasmid) [Vibrio navarrensis]|uniref:IS3 family transposase n=1 Tax=Vibrio navarrensis TaxID=29495 RepID=A0AAJ4IH88_9VIBR|nr:IS3 family transposase [Vibrio navarrensis]